MMELFDVNVPGAFDKAGPTDLIRLEAARGKTPIFIQKWQLEVLMIGLVRAEKIHLSGPTGAAKSSLVECLMQVPKNFESLCRAMNLELKPLVISTIQMATFESPAELYSRRSLEGGCTYDERSAVVRALEEAEARGDRAYNVIWLRELGRTHSATVQGGLNDLVARGSVVLPDGRTVDCRFTGWITDSNYQAAEASPNSTLVTLDDALSRRFTMPLTLDYLNAEQELSVLHHLTGAGDVPTEDDDELKLLNTVVKLGHVIRARRAEGQLLSVPPPTIYGYLTFVSLARALRHMSPDRIAMATLLGNAGAHDARLIPGVLNEALGRRNEDDGELVAEDLF